MRSIRVSRFIPLFAFAAITGSSFADDLYPPPWRLSNSTATVQEWDFNSANLPLAPDGSTWGSGGGGFINPYGTPLLTQSTSALHFPSVAGRNGVYVMPGGPPLMEFYIPNDPLGVGPKEVWVQICWYAGGTPFRPDVTLLSNAYTGPVSLINEFAKPDGWTHSTFAVILPSKPSSERLLLNNFSPVAIAVDQVVIDTICVPEPASLAALGLACAAFLKRRGRRD